MSTTLTTGPQAKEFVENASIEWQQMAPGVKRKIMAYQDSLMLVRVAFETGGVGTLHKHYHAQISHVESGSFEVEIAGVKKVLNVGDVFNVPSNVLHGAVCLQAGVLIDAFSPMREDFFLIAK
jgi:quercetin dioxygenase-like cupin family protein